MPDTCYVIVQLLDSSDKPVVRPGEGRRQAEFYYVKPGNYYLRAFVDMNGNGIWDTGDYDEDRQAEPVYYFNEEMECKAEVGRQPRRGTSPPTPLPAEAPPSPSRSPTSRRN